MPKNSSLCTENSQVLGLFFQCITSSIAWKYCARCVTQIPAPTDCPTKAGSTLCVFSGCVKRSGTLAPINVVNGEARSPGARAPSPGSWQGCFRGHPGAWNLSNHWEDRSTFYRADFMLRIHAQHTQMKPRARFVEFCGDFLMPHRWFEGANQLDESRAQSDEQQNRNNEQKQCRHHLYYLCLRPLLALHAERIGISMQESHYSQRAKATSR